MCNMPRGQWAVCAAAPPSVRNLRFPAAEEGDGYGARACVRADDAADARLPDGRLVPQKERPAVIDVFLQKRV